MKESEGDQRGGGGGGGGNLITHLVSVSRAPDAQLSACSSSVQVHSSWQRTRPVTLEAAPLASRRAGHTHLAACTHLTSGATEWITLIPSVAQACKDRGLERI